VQTTIEHHLRIDPHPRKSDFAAGFAARIHDPLWFLTRQWQMGEFQGENAATPVRVDYSLVTTPIMASPVAPAADPTRIPAESIIEDHPDSWWTTGRRLRIGARIADGYTIGHTDRFTPPPPYHHLIDRPDGLAIWRRRAALQIPDAEFDALGVPRTRESAWKSDELVYATQFPTGDPESDSATLSVVRHRGGDVDWVTADASSAYFAGDRVDREGRPSPLHYPGAPVSRWWEFEDAAVDIGGYPPDSAHPVTALLIELICTHGDDWFVFPIDVPVGHVATLPDASITVTDSFGDRTAVTAPVDDWSMFTTTGADVRSLVLWLRAVTPLEGPILDDVLFGMDEYANVLWAVERRIAGQDVTEPDAPAAPAPDEHPRTEPRAGDPGTRRYRYLAGIAPQVHWHPYEIDRDSEIPRFVQRAVADLSSDPPHLIAPPTAQVLRVHTDAGEAVHTITPATIPSSGTHLESRYKLARGTDGTPCLWLERHRAPVLRPPGRTVRFDDVVEV
jgi:hypothetical protein